ADGRGTRRCDPVRAWLRRGGDRRVPQPADHLVGARGSGLMSIEIRQVTAAEMPAFNDVSAYVFGSSPHDFSILNDPMPASPWVPLPPEGTLAAFVDGRIATSFGAHDFTLQLNGRPVRAAGVTQVGTYPEFRRRGILRRVMVEALTRFRDEGRP